MQTRMHSSKMCTAHSSSHLGWGVSTSPPDHCPYPTLTLPSGVVAFCYGLLALQKAIPEGHLQTEG